MKGIAICLPDDLIDRLDKESVTRSIFITDLLEKHYREEDGELL